ncbi:hypothetical protein HPB47_015773 [Ixodes persulcatus]|uniref:Uncharacterized protein n=1 Tax=Ixodes persulcatus TaxID=34615 RepID=A0AC60QSK5_IXOPE|nr:hypothetical protein HPB47_015773 [Ixodes persulcatus]
MTSKRKRISLKEKLEIIQAIDQGTKQSAVADIFGLSKQTVNTIMKNKEAVLGKQVTSDLQPKKFRLREATFQNLFKARDGVTFKCISGESDGVDDGVVVNWKNQSLPGLLAGYEPHNIFNADQSGLYKKMRPGKNYSLSGEPCYGGKRSKERNCFRKAAFVFNNSEEPVPLVDNPDEPEPGFREAVEKAFRSEEFSDYVNVGADVVSTEQLTDEEIVAQVRGLSTWDQEEGEEGDE